MPITITPTDLLKKYWPILLFAALLGYIIYDNKFRDDDDDVKPDPEYSDVSKVAHAAIIRLADEHAAIRRAAAKKAERGDFDSVEEQKDWVLEKVEEGEDTAWNDYDTLLDTTIGRRSNKQTYDAEASADFYNAAADGFEKVK